MREKQHDFDNIELRLHSYYQREISKVTTPHLPVYAGKASSEKHVLEILGQAAAVIFIVCAGSLLFLADIGTNDLSQRITEIYVENNLEHVIKKNLLKTQLFLRTHLMEDQLSAGNDIE
jgi:hypothetical protein